MSLIAGLEQTRAVEFLVEVNKVGLRYVLGSFVLSHFVRPQKSVLYCR